MAWFLGASRYGVSGVRSGYGQAPSGLRDCRQGAKGEGRNDPLVGPADRYGAPGQPGKRMRLVSGGAGSVGQFQCLPVAALGARPLTANPVHGPYLVECCGLTESAADLTVDAKRLLRADAGHVVAKHLQHCPKLVEGTGFVELVTAFAVAQHRRTELGMA